MKFKKLPKIHISSTLEYMYNTNDEQFYICLQNRFQSFRDLIQNGVFNSDNCLEILNILVDLEVIGLNKIYRKLSQNNVEISGCAGEYSAKVSIYYIIFLHYIFYIKHI